MSSFKLTLLPSATIPRSIPLQNHTCSSPSLTTRRLGRAFPEGYRKYVLAYVHGALRAFALAHRWTCSTLLTLTSTLSSTRSADVKFGTLRVISSCVAPHHAVLRSSRPS